MASNAPHGWTDDQKRELQDLVAKLGARWTRIASHLNRTAYVCRSAYKRIVDADGKHVMPRAADGRTVLSFEATQGTSPRPWTKFDVTLAITSELVSL